MNIIVTGGNGFIGSHLVKKLNNLEHHVLVLDKKSNGDITKENILERVNADVLIHLAALITGNSNDIFNTNVYGTYNLTRANVKKFINISSAAVHDTSSDYGMSKYLAEKIVRRSGLDYVNLRLFNVYGKGGYGLINKLIESRDNNTVVKVNGDGTHTRDYIHVDDVCDAIIKSIDLKSWTYDIGTDKSYSVNEVIELFNKVSGQNKVRVEYLPEIKEIEHSKANSIIYQAKISLEEGLIKIW